MLFGLDIINLDKYQFDYSNTVASINEATITNGNEKIEKIIDYELKFFDDINEPTRAENTSYDKNPV